MAMDMYKLGQMLGNAYGNLWVANANKRQEKKADDIIKGLGNVTPEDVTNSVNGPESYIGTSNISINDVAQQMPANAISANIPTGLAPQTIQPPANSIGAGLTPEEQAAALKAGNTGLAWKPQYSANDLEKALRAGGVGKEVMAKKLAEYNKDTAEQAQREMLPEIIKQLGEGKTGDALQAILQYSKYDPTTSNMLLKDYQSALQFNRQKEMQDRQFANQKELANINAANRIAYKQTVGGGSKTKTTKPEKMLTAEGLEKQITTLQNEIESLPSGSPAFMKKSATLDKLRGEKEALLNYGIEGQREYNAEYKAEREYFNNNDLNPGNWNSVAAFANEMIYRQGVPPRQAIQALKDAGIPSDFVKALEGSYSDIL